MRSSIRAGGFVLERLPVRADPAEYERASAEIEATLQRIPGLIAIYSTGGVTVPGISDIDRIAVVEGAAPVRSTWSSLSNGTRRLALHAPFVVDRSTFARHRWFAHLEPLELRWGDPVPFVDPPRWDLAHWLLAVEGASMTALKLMKLALMGRIKVRSVLCELHTLRFALSLGGLSEGQAQTAWRFTTDAAALRMEWFDLPLAVAVKRLLGLVDDAWPAAIATLKALVARDDAGCGRPPAQLPLGAAWRNVVLAPGEPAPTALAAASAGSARALWSRSRRGAAFVWQARTRTLRLPGPVVAALGDPGRGEEYGADRRQIVREYRGFLEELAPAYSGIGLAPQLLPR